MRPPAPNLLKKLNLFNNEPLELEYLYTAARAVGWEAVIYDGFYAQDGPKKTIEREKPDVVAITGYNVQREKILKYAKTAKEVNPKIICVAGGVHAQVHYKDFYDKSIDYVFRSEDVNAFGRLLEKFAGKIPDSETRISGLCERTGDGYVETPLEPFDINELPIPDRTYFYETKSRYNYVDMKELASIKTSISCPYDCSFCYCKKLGGGRFSARDLGLVIEELRGLDCDSVMILDDTFLYDAERVKDFIRRVKEAGIKKKYLCYSRADFIAANPDIIKELAEIGFVYFLVGIESSFDDDLISYNKRTTIDINERCIEVMKDSGAYLYAMLIAPLDADEAWFERLYDWIVERGLIYATVSIFTPFPGTDIYEEYKDSIIAKKDSDWDFLHLVVEPAKLTKRQYYTAYVKLIYRLFNRANLEGSFKFVNLEYCKNVFLDYFREKFRELG
jgi:radical SAM superfamily enzyme YgiQ (UPF0313 family)